MAKYLLLKHCRGAPAPFNDVPMDQWTPEEQTTHAQQMEDFTARLKATGEFVDSRALSPQGTFVRSDGDGRPPVTDGQFAETKDLIAGWMIIDVETYERAVELAGEGVRGSGSGCRERGAIGTASALTHPPLGPSSSTRQSEAVVNAGVLETAGEGSAPAPGRMGCTGSGLTAALTATRRRRPRPMAYASGKVRVDRP